ncbi:MAG TPA: EAL domain-containing response regulator [Thermoanaerobaculia bacterium]|nr:EAL domain-containing response regulator [Thermoanaerobaculia bacterium]
MPRVLILDDESMVLDMLVVCLSAPGIHLTTCREIEAAEALLSCLRFDVVITDLSVSELGGLEGIRLIRFVTTHFPDTAVYVLSGYVTEAARELCKVLGVTAVLEKPGGLTELRRLLLEHQAAAGAGPDSEEPGQVQQVELLEEFLAANTIRSVLQPVVKLRPGGAPFEVFGVEGLARGPATSVLGNPLIFLGYAAHKELLFKADMICIQAALAEVRQLGSVVNTFLNVQPRSMTNPDFTEHLAEVVRASGLSEGNIILELTEQQTIVNPRAFAATLQRLRERGFRIALDDYGEGSSNLNLFQDLRPDYLKISGTFCRNLARDPFKQILVQSTAEMAARTGTATIMEAVESEEEAEILTLLGIDYGQGFFFLEPLPGQDLARSTRVGLPNAAPSGRSPALGASPSIP